MSGGVDSSVVAGLLVEQGHDVIGVHMKLHDQPARPLGEAADKHCCGLDDALDARRVAERLGIPFFVMDLQEAFRAAVIDDFARTYRAGATPNPCIQCNGVLKFRVLLQRARALGASHLATGHYARVLPDGGLGVAADLTKDQSYFLFPVTRDALGATLFPLGEMTKPEVRAHAARLGLVTADKPESQDVCFIPDDDHARFVREAGPDDGAGEIVHQDGRVLGAHDGFWRFTIGQRRGLNVALGEPMYVLGIDPDTRQVTVGPPESLQHGRLLARAMNWFTYPAPEQILQARIRHRGRLRPCTVHRVGDDRAEVRFLEPARAAARGQAVVIYDGGAVVAGGWIDEVYG
ncbi:MAG: tRNA 2-thiouridine(34) synthase MnmA [Myxococcota bacterium]|nr:tRNA 2-thiouridine(34) synthase MnmA [Myxococcota bacterium]